jgi:hypothetical protein
MSDRPTPETDAAVWMTGEPWDEKDEVVCSGFARKLERERDEARRDIDSALTYGKNLERLTERLYDRAYTGERERDYARQQNAQLRAELARRKEGGAQ